MSKVMISVILATYNGEKYIQEQLNSIRNQSLSPNEVLIMDDCSTDNTVRVIKDYIEENELINSWKVIVNSCNMGWKKNFKNGLTYVSGDVIFFSDQDDIWDERKIQRLSETLEAYKDVNVVACSENLLINGKIEEGRFIKKYGIISSQDYADIIHNPSGCCMCVKKSFYEKYKHLYLDNFAHDSFFWTMGCITESAYYIEDALVDHRITGKNISRQKNRSAIKRLKIICDDLSRTNYLLDQTSQDSTIDTNYLRWKRDGLTLRINVIKKHSLFSVLKLFFFYKDLYLVRNRVFADFVSGFIREIR